MADLQHGTLKAHTGIQKILLLRALRIARKEEGGRTEAHFQNDRVIVAVLRTVKRPEDLNLRPAECEGLARRRHRDLLTSLRQILHEALECLRRACRHRAVGCPDRRIVQRTREPADVVGIHMRRHDHIEVAEAMLLQPRIYIGRFLRLTAIDQHRLTAALNHRRVALPDIKPGHRQRPRLRGPCVLCPCVPGRLRGPGTATCLPAACIARLRGGFLRSRRCRRLRHMLAALRLSRRLQDQHRCEHTKNGQEHCTHPLHPISTPLFFHTMMPSFFCCTYSSAASPSMSTCFQPRHCIISPLVLLFARGSADSSRNQSHACTSSILHKY